MKRSSKLKFAGIAVLGATAVLAMRPDSAAEKQAAALAATIQAHSKLGTLSVSDRKNVDYPALDARLKRLAEKPFMVGIAVGIVENGRITFLSGYGETLAGSGEKVSPDTVFRWASVSKGVAGAMIGKLAEQGKVSFSDPIAKYGTNLRLPGGAEQRATVSDLMSHRLGLYRNAYDNKLEEGQDPRFLRQTLAQLNLICEPGTCWSYQNVAYDASAEIVEKVSGKPYPEMLQETLFNPLGMSSANATREGLVTARSWARPHSAGRRPLEVLEPYYRVPAAGGVNSNIKDLSLWMIAQMGLRPDVLSPAVLNTIHAPLVRTPGERGRLRKFLERLGDANYGYGWRSYGYAGHRIVGHRGGVAGYRSLIMFDPQLKSGVVALWNSSTSKPGGLEFEVMDMIYKLPFRDWMELDGAGAPAPSPQAAEAEEEQGNGSPVRR